MGQHLEGRYHMELIRAFGLTAMVPEVGLEPTCLATSVLEADVYTNSTIPTCEDSRTRTYILQFDRALPTELMQTNCMMDSNHRPWHPLVLSQLSYIHMEALVGLEPTTL